jgi:hypothetical protein
MEIISLMHHLFVEQFKLLSLNLAVVVVVASLNKVLHLLRSDCG